MRAVFVGAFCLLLVAIGLLLLAISLIPTDLGLTHLIGAYVFGAAGGLGLVIGFAGRAVLRSASATATTPTVASRAAVIPAATDAVSVSPEPEPAPKIELPSSRAPTILAAGAAAGAAGLAAGAALGGFTRSEPREPVAPPDLAVTALEPAGPADDRFLDELERDLFAEVQRPDLTEPLAAEGPAPMADPVAQEEIIEADQSSSPANVDHSDIDQTAHPQAELSQDDLLPLPGDMPATEMVADIGESSDDLADQPSPSLNDETTMAIAADLTEAASLPEAMGMSAADDLPAPEDTPPGISGLIPDADSAALAEAVETLAPLETLDIVGSYDSGGTRFTMYSDGSVTAKGESVDRRFPSLDALRAFIDGGMKD